MAPAPRKPVSSADVPIPHLCKICGHPASKFLNPEYCWTCNRLRIQAWRDTEREAGADAPVPAL